MGICAPAGTAGMGLCVIPWTDLAIGTILTRRRTDHWKEPAGIAGKMELWRYGGWIRRTVSKTAKERGRYGPTQSFKYTMPVLYFFAFFASIFYHGVFCNTAYYTLSYLQFAFLDF